MGLPRNALSEAPAENGTERPTELQSHVAFFDRDGDGVIWPIDTYVPRLGLASLIPKMYSFRGLRAIGFNFLFALFSMIVIHGGFS